jgi:hypothetical protein
LGPLGVRATSGWSGCVGKARDGAWTRYGGGRVRGGVWTKVRRREGAGRRRRRGVGRLENFRVPLFERVKLQKVE